MQLGMFLLKENLCTFQLALFSISRGISLDFNRFRILWVTGVRVEFQFRHALQHLRSKRHKCTFWYCQLLARCIVQFSSSLIAIISKMRICCRQSHRKLHIVVHLFMLGVANLNWRHWRCGKFTLEYIYNSAITSAAHSAFPWSHMILAVWH